MKGLLSLLLVAFSLNSYAQMNVDLGLSVSANGYSAVENNVVFKDLFRSANATAYGLYNLGDFGVGGSFGVKYDATRVPTWELVAAVIGSYGETFPVLFGLGSSWKNEFATYRDFSAYLFVAPGIRVKVNDQVRVRAALNLSAMANFSETAWSKAWIATAIEQELAVEFAL